MQTLCPHCGKRLRVSVAVVVSPPPPSPDFDPNDSVQIRGYQDAQFNDVKRAPGEYRKCPFADRSDEFYRYNRGMWAFWNGIRI